jgi:prevent-host-death family protein
MQTIQASEAQTRFLHILDEVERGESVLIARNGQAVARLTPEAQVDSAAVAEAIESMKALRKRTSKLSLAEIRSARDEGRA